ncbi:MAG: DUF3404 domain-containing protein, partial [Bdellovibrionia bacterium]
MRIYGAAALISLMLALGSGLAYLAYGRRAPQLDEIAAAKSEFVKTAKPTANVDLSGIQIDADAVLPKTFEFDFKEVAEFSERAGDCTFGPVKDPRLKKAARWHRWMCGLEGPPDTAFFIGEPLYHPLGGTYAARSVSKMAGDPAWIKKVANAFHLSEFELLPPEILTETQRRLGALSLANLERLRDAERIVRAGDEIWLRDTKDEFTLKKYSVYKSADWDSQHAGAPYLFVDDPGGGQPCVQSEGRGCWIRNERVQSAPIRFLIFALMLSVGGMALSMGLLIRAWLRARRRDDEDRRFVLQMLTHELRTPATSLNLNIETIREGFDRLAANQQDSFLRMCNDVQRLKNVIEASTAYLQIERRDGVTIQPADIPSLNSWIEQMLEEEGRPVVFTKLEPDRGLRTDPYWLSLCLRNLIRNAYDHGAPPVALRIENGVG